MAGINAVRLAESQPAMPFPPTTALGCLGRYISTTDAKDYQPTNMAFGLLPPLATPLRDKRARREMLVRRALDDLGTFRATLDPVGTPR
jgi:methylenetetrahydrofolate--tRNA-(uracil-5-)-methyltransferase